MLTKSLGYIAAGIKLINISYTDHNLKELINIPISSIYKVQSHKRYFPIELLLSVDKKETHETFNNFFIFIANIVTNVSENKEEYLT